MATDIQSKHFVFRNTPASWHPYVKIMRLDRPVGTWLLLLPCFWALALSSENLSAINWYYVLLFSAGALLMRGAGCTVNDLWDRNLDAAVARTNLRPLPAREISPRQALALLTALLLISFVILLQFNSLTICLGVLSLGLVAVYPLMKRVTWWPQAFLGLTFNWGALMGWTAMTGEIAPAAILLYAGGIFWTLAYDTVYAHQDKEDDALIGVKSTARLFGGASRRWVAAFFAICLIFFAGAKYMAAGAVPFLVILPALHAAWQICRWDIDKPESCLKVFKSNRDFGLLVLVLFAVNF